MKITDLWDAAQPPFSFLLDNVSSHQLLSSWTRREESSDTTTRHLVWSDSNGLEISARVRVLNEFAVEWVLEFFNGGTQDSGLIEHILPLDVTWSGASGDDVTLHHARGSESNEEDFLPISQPITPHGKIALAPERGRSSDGALPFMNLQSGQSGVVIAVGWTGQWRADFERDGDTLRARAGMETTRLRLHAGERIRTPSILLVEWQGDDHLSGNNRLRRVLLEHFCPRINGELALPPICQNTWFAFNEGNDVTEENQLANIAFTSTLGIETHWLDAGWFEGGWPHGVGSWVPKAAAFPRGLKPLSDAAHERGMKFLLWFEMERVDAKSRLAGEHPEWVLHEGEGDGLLDLANPDALAWLIEFLSSRIEEWGIDVYRQDFNIDPLRFWRAKDATEADAPHREGIAEIHYITAMYALWDALLQRHPHLIIDNCSSGGRRIDLETTRRSLPLWRSDTPVFGGYPIQDQTQSAGLSLWLPLHSSGVWEMDAYSFRSVATTGVNICSHTQGEGYDVDLTRRGIAELKSLRAFQLGDYYPLLPITSDEHAWCGWQFDRPDLAEGFAVLFRRPQAPLEKVEVELRGLEDETNYIVTTAREYEESAPMTMSGAQLANYEAHIDTAPRSVLIRYRKVAA